MWKGRKEKVGKGGCFVVGCWTLWERGWGWFDLSSGGMVWTKGEGETERKPGSVSVRVRTTGVWAVV